MTPTTPTVEAPPERGEFIPNAMPATIHLIDGQVFEVTDIDAWGYIPQGVFATGHFALEESERDLVIYADRIAYIELDFAALKAYIAEQDHANPRA